MADPADQVGEIIENLDPGAFVTRFVLIAEVISEDGRRGVWTSTHDDATRWDLYGLLMETMNDLNASHLKE